MSTNEKVIVKCDRCNENVARETSVVKQIRVKKKRILCSNCKRELQLEYFHSHKGRINYQEY